jgi:hypothetical protein
MSVILATQEAKIRKMEFESSPGKIQDPISTNKLDMLAHTCHPSYSGGVNRRIQVQA